MTKSLPVIMMMNTVWWAYLCLELIKDLIQIHWWQSKYTNESTVTYLIVHLLLHWELTTFLFLSCHYRQRHKGQRLRGDDADWLWSNGHQDPPHQVFHHPTFAPGQQHGHVLPALPNWQPGRASCRRAGGVCLRSPAAPVLSITPQLNPWRQSRT